MKSKNGGKNAFWLLLFFLVLNQHFGYAQRKALDIYANGDVRMLIIDPLGRKLGYDPVTSHYYTEIPGGNIGAAGIDIVTDEGGEEDSSQSNPIEAMIGSAAEDGEYKIIVFGTKLNFFYIDIGAWHIDGPIVHTGGSGVIDSASVIVFHLSYYFNDRGKTDVKKEVTVTTIRQDLLAGYKLNLLGDEKLFEDLGKDIDKFEKELFQRDSIKARDKLEEFEKKLDKEREETIKHEQKQEKPKKQFVTKSAYQILKEDVQLLLATLPRKR